LHLDIRPLNRPLVAHGPARIMHQATGKWLAVLEDKVRPGGHITLSDSPDTVWFIGFEDVKHPMPFVKEFFKSEFKTLSAFDMKRGIKMDERIEFRMFDWPDVDHDGRFVNKHDPIHRFDTLYFRTEEGEEDMFGRGHLVHQMSQQYITFVLDAGDPYANEEYLQRDHYRMTCVPDGSKRTPLLFFPATDVKYKTKAKAIDEDRDL